MAWKYRTCSICKEEFTHNAIHVIDGVAQCKWCCTIDFGPIIVYRECDVCGKELPVADMIEENNTWRCLECPIGNNFGGLFKK